jgi:hypothetical protein
MGASQPQLLRTPNTLDYTFKQNVMAISSFVVLMRRPPHGKEKGRPLLNDASRAGKEKLRKFLPQPEPR